MMGKGNTKRVVVVGTGVDDGRGAIVAGRGAAPTIGMGGNGVSVGCGAALRVSTTYWFSARLPPRAASTLPFAASARTLSR